MSEGQVYLQVEYAGMRLVVLSGIVIVVVNGLFINLPVVQVGTSKCASQQYDREGREGAAGGRIMEREGFIEESREDHLKRSWER